MRLGRQARASRLVRDSTTDKESLCCHPSISPPKSRPHWNPWHGTERLLASQPLPEGTQGDYDALREHLTVTKGKSTLSIPIAFAKQLLTHLDPQELAHLFRILPRELCLYFHAARTDYKQGILNNGRFALSRLDGAGKIRPLRRMCAMGGRSPDSLTNSKQPGARFKSCNSFA